MAKISVITPSIRPEGLKVVQDSLEAQTFQDFEWLVELSIPSRGYDLNRAYNRLLRRAKGELVVSYQDFIKAPPTGLQAFWDAHDDQTFITAPVGKVKEWGQEPNWDWRHFPFAKSDWLHWEIDWACAPLEALVKIGGFDEELDFHTWTFDNVNVGLRAGLAGYQFLALPQNEAIALDHDAMMPHPFRGNINSTFHNQRLQEIRMGLKLDYLNKSV